MHHHHSVLLVARHATGEIPASEAMEDLVASVPKEQGALGFVGRFGKEGAFVIERGASSMRATFERASMEITDRVLIRPADARWHAFAKEETDGLAWIAIEPLVCETDAQCALVALGRADGGGDSILAELPLLARAARVFALAMQAEERRAAMIHQMKNSLAAVLTNVEFAHDNVRRELGKASHEERSEVERAMSEALAASRRLLVHVRALEQQK